MHLEARPVEMPLGEGAIVADRFQLVRELGHGAMGSVWLARHKALNIPCAVKFIRKGSAGGDARMRFEREARAAAQIRSPYVVQILDYGVWEDQPYIAMEYLEGETLGARIRRCGRLPAAEVIAFATQIAQGLSKAHALGIVHRDLKPDNVFLIRDEDVFTRGHRLTLVRCTTAKILDFGIAKSPDLGGEGFSKTRTGSILGTPHYMSPEQIDSAQSIDGRSDLWSLAVVIYQCFVGRLPFGSESLGELLMQVIERPIPVPSRIAAHVPPEFDAWWARAAARDPAQRFQSAAELVDALSDALGFRSGSPDALAESPASATSQSAPSEAPPEKLSIDDGLDDDRSCATDPGAESYLRRRGRIRAAISAVAALSLIGAAMFVLRSARPSSAGRLAAALPVATTPEPAAAPALTAATATATAEERPQVTVASAGSTAEPPSTSASSAATTNPARGATLGARPAAALRRDAPGKAHAAQPAKSDLGF